MATEPKDLLNELVGDAKRVAAYGQRTGRLKDYTLLEAIGAVEKLPELTWGAKEVITLQASLNGALQNIYPTTLADLRGDWEPFGSTRSRVGQLAFVLATLVIMATTALATFEYNRGVALLKAASAMQKDDPRSEMGLILRQLLDVQLAAATNGTKTAVILDEPHYALVDKLHQIDAQVAVYVPPLIKFRNEHPLPHELLFGRPTGISGDIATLVKTPGYGQYKCGTAPPAGTVAQATGTQVEKTATLVAQVDGLATSPGDQTSNALGAGTDEDDAIIAALTHHLKEIEAVSCTTKLTYGPLSIPSIGGFVDELVDWSNIWGLWYLPALYGALGAMLYYMRRILDPTIPDPSAIRVIHRTALGAFAGVIVTWFWAPNSELSEGFTSIGITIFTLAFLIGFSIEVLFSLLDRLVSTMIDMAKGNGKPPPPTLPAGT